MGAIDSILVEVPNGKLSPTAVSLIERLGKRKHTDIELITVIPSASDLLMYFEDDALETELHGAIEVKAQAALDVVVKEIEKFGVRCSSHLSKGFRIRRLVRRIVQKDFDLLMKDASVESVGDHFVFEPVDNKLVRHCPCPLWLIRGERSIDGTGKVVVALDTKTDGPLEEELNARMLRYGAAMANLFKTDLEIITAWALEGATYLRGCMDSDKFAKVYSSARDAAEERLRQLTLGISLEHGSVQQHLLEGEPARAVAKYCRKHPIQTLVLGTVGRSGLLGYLIGNTAESILARVTCSVLVVGPHELPSAVKISVDEELKRSSGKGKNC